MNENQKGDKLTLKGTASYLKKMLDFKYFNHYTVYQFA